MAKSKPQAHIWFTIYLNGELDQLASEAANVARGAAFAASRKLEFEDSSDKGYRDYRLIVDAAGLLDVLAALKAEGIKHGTIDLYGIAESDPLVNQAQALTSEVIEVMD